jgi:hypothetical protein
MLIFFISSTPDPYVCWDICASGNVQVECAKTDWKKRISFNEIVISFFLFFSAGD